MTFAVEGGCFAYKKQAPVLRDVSFEARPGELCAILGPNGAGKTTLLRCAMGFLRWTSGRSLLGGEDIAKLPPRTLWRRMAYVPQAKGGAVSYTVEEMVLLGRGGSLGAFAVPGARDLEAVSRVLGELGLSALREKRCSELSGGELQMVLIARALAAEPEVLILDEPESNLDFRNQLLVMDTLSALAARGMTCVFNTHYPSHALRRAGRALLLSRDGTAVFGKTDEVVTERALERAFGVRAVIGEIDTDGGTVRDVIPLEIRKEDAT